VRPVHWFIVCGRRFLPNHLMATILQMCTSKGPRKRPFFRPWSPLPTENHSSPVGTFLFSEVSFMPAASAMVSISAAKSFCR